MLTLLSNATVYVKIR